MKNIALYFLGLISIITALMGIANKYFNEWESLAILLIGIISLIKYAELINAKK